MSELRRLLKPLDGAEPWQPKNVNQANAANTLRQYQLPQMEVNAAAPIPPPAAQAAAPAAAAAPPWQPKNPAFDKYGTNSLRGMHASGQIESAADAQRALAAQQAPAAPIAPSIAQTAAAEDAAAKAALNRASPVGAPPEAPPIKPAVTAVPVAPVAAAPAAEAPGKLRGAWNKVAGVFGGGAPVEPVAPAPPGALRTGLNNVGNAFKAVGPSLVAGAAGAGLAQVTRGVGNPAASPGQAQDVGSAALIPAETGDQAARDSVVANAKNVAPYNFFTDNDTGRNLGNLASAASMVPGVGALTGGLRLGTGTAKAVTAATKAEAIGLPFVAGAAQNIRQGREDGATPTLRTPAVAAPANPAGPEFTDDDARVNKLLARSGTGAVSQLTGADGVRDYSNQRKNPFDTGLRTTDHISFEQAQGERAMRDANERQLQGKYAADEQTLRNAQERAAMSARPAALDTRAIDGQIAEARNGNRIVEMKALLDSKEAMQRDHTQQNTSVMQNATALAGQGVTERGNALQANATLRSNGGGAEAQRKQANDDRTYALAAGTQAQALGEKYRENAKKEFEVFGADNKPDLAASQQSFNAMRQLFPQMESADEGTRNKAMADAKEMAGIFNKARSSGKVGMDAMAFWNAERPSLSGMPDARGGTTEQTGFLGGLVTIGASNGDTLLSKDGREVNLGKLTARQRELLDTAKKSGWGN